MKKTIQTLAKGMFLYNVPVRYLGIGTFVHLFFLFAGFTLFSCTQEERIDRGVVLTDKAEPEIAGGQELSGHGSFLIWLNSKDENAKKIAESLQAVNHYDEMKSIEDLPGEDKEEALMTLARDSLNDLTVVGDVADFIAGTYKPETLQDIRHNHQGVVLIALEGEESDLKAQMLQLFGLYISRGYYRVCFPREQRYSFYDSGDPEAIRKLCGTRGLDPDTRGVASPGPTDDPSDPKVTARAMAALKRIFISNRFFVYTNDYKYKMTGYEPLHPYTAEVKNFVPKEDKRYAAFLDREWTIDAYNLRIYAPTNGDNLLAVYCSGGNGFSNRLENSTVALQNPPKNEIWGLVWGLRNKAYSKVGIRDEQKTKLNLKLVDFAPGLPESETTISHSQKRSVGFKLGVNPELEGVYIWGKSITYQLAEMTRKVLREINDIEMNYCWEWYPETLFQGKQALKADGMVDGSAMVTPVWYDVLYDNVGTDPGSDNVFCDYNNDPQFNQNMFNYQQECAITYKTGGASAGVVAIEVTDGMLLQRGGAWFNSWGAPSLHPFPSDSGIGCDATVDVHHTVTIWIDYNNW